MKLATLAVPTGTTLAALIDNTFVDITQHWSIGTSGQAVTAPTSVTEVIVAGDRAIEHARSVLDKLDSSTPRMDPADCHVLPPHLPASTVFCVGVNYQDHAAEAGSGAVLPEAPTYFAKDPRSFCGAQDTIPVPSELTSMLDWEVELAVVIGRPGGNISASSALQHVAGYMIVNDVTARDVQMERGQWFLGKNLSASSPIGPYLVTADEVDDPQSLTISCTVDGQRRQHANTKDMIHSVADLIADLSRFVDLRVGDVICTGTPAGVGAAASPPAFLTHGSRMVTEISGLGRQENIVADPARAKAPDAK